MNDDDEHDEAPDADGFDVDFGFMIAVIEHLNSIDPLTLVEVVMGQVIAEHGELDHLESLAVRHAVLATYNAIVCGAALASVVS